MLSRKLRRVRTAAPVTNTPTFVEAGLTSSSTGSISCGALSSVVSGDLILLVVQSLNVTVNTPSTYSPAVQVTYGTSGSSTSCRLTVFYKFATGADESVTVTDTGNHTIATKVAYRGVDSDTPADVAILGDTGTTTTVSYPALTTVSDDCLVVLICATANDTDTAVMGTSVAGNLESLTERFDESATSGYGGGIWIADGPLLLAGTTGALSSTMLTAESHAQATIALRPSP